MPSYADRMNASKQNFEAAVAPASAQKKNQRDAGLAADIAAELLDADRPESVLPPIAVPSITRESVAPVVAPTAVVETPPVAKHRPKVRHQGVTFREGDLDVITDMLYYCHSMKIRLPGKKGSSIVVLAALDEIQVTVYQSHYARREQDRAHRFSTLLRPLT